MPTFNFLYSIPYIILFLLLYVNVIPLYKSSAGFSFRNNYSIWVQQFFVIALLIIFFGFRGFVYTDWINYYRIYDISPSLFDGPSLINKFIERSSEKGFLLYMIICKTISPNYFFFQFASCIIDFIILYYFFKRIISEHIIFGFVLFIIFSGISIEFNLFRNSKAMMLFLISLKYMEERKFIKYVLLNSIGCLFHITSLLYLPLYFILNKNFSRKVILFIFIIGNIIFLLQIEWCKYILSFISSLIPGRLGVILKTYLLSDYYSRAYGITIGYLERFFSFIIFFCFSKKLYGINRNNIIYINAYYIYIFIFLYFSELLIIPERVATLFLFSYWILYPQTYSLLRKNNKKLFLVFLLFYGILKLGVGNKNILTLYDNVLLQHKSFYERSIIMNQHSKYIFNK